VAKLGGSLREHQERARELADEIHKHARHTATRAQCRVAVAASLEGSRKVGRLAAAEDSFLDRYEDDTLYEAMETAYEINEEVRAELEEHCLRESTSGR
jgi:hypothetical protein